MRLRYAWIDIPWIILAIVLLIPLLSQLIRIVAQFVGDVQKYGL